jgi:endothelin-converting enzyme
MKEYYADDDVREMYRRVLERLIVSLTEEESKFMQKKRDALVNQAESVWPPWPWPPWGDDDGGGDEDEDPKPNRTVDAHKLAEKVLQLESKIAAVSLDL